MIRTAAVITHRRPEVTAEALASLLTAAARVGVSLCCGVEEIDKHGDLESLGASVGDGLGLDVDICFALGGDGTILTALRAYAGTGVPVFGVNYGEMGFLATVDRENADEGWRRALTGDFEMLSLPAIELSDSHGHRWLAMNDVSINRQQGNRVADLGYSVGADEVGRVRCDGLVVATPAGSTGYNLANGGPVMAWGVEGFVVSFIAPHSLTARPLVVAPGRSGLRRQPQPRRGGRGHRRRPADVPAGGRREHAGSVLADQGTLAQIPGTSFYSRLRQKFGRLA